MSDLVQNLLREAYEYAKPETKNERERREAAKQAVRDYGISPDCRGVAVHQVLKAWNLRNPITA